MSEQNLNQAQQCHQSGRLTEAEALYRKILESDPDNPDALYGLGLVLFLLQRASEGVPFLHRAIAQQPDRAGYHHNLGVVLESLDRRPEAIASYRRALELNADFPGAAFNLAGALHDDGDLHAAVAVYRWLIDQHPDHAAAHINLGNVLCKLGRYSDGIVVAREACRLRPDWASGWQTLGNALVESGQTEPALEAYRRALDLDLTRLSVLSAMSRIFVTSGRREENVAVLRRLVALAPQDAAAHWSLAWSLLALGLWDEGWTEAEWRPRDHRPELGESGQPLWDGSPIAGKTLLIFSDGGHGDEINFIRYVPLAAASGAKVILECHPALLELFRQVPCVWKLIPRGQPLPQYDYYISVLSLPRIFRTTVGNVPAQEPRLVAPPDRIEKFRDKIPRGGELKVGLVWSGRAARSDIRTRVLDVYAPLADVHSVRFFSLQFGPEASQTPPLGMNLIDLSGDIADFADTAGLLTHLDLLISVDTAPAHLAGAMGKPVWIVNPFLTDYRWLLDRRDSPWYPTMRIFRQPADGNWIVPVQQMRSELQILAVRHSIATGVKVP